MEPVGKQILDFEQIIVRNAERARLLLGVPALSEVLLIAQTHEAIAQAMAELLTAILAFCYPPIGAVMAWHKNASLKMPPLPPNWAECNGQILDDPASPLQGITLPDLNGAQYFLRGGSPSGQTGGATEHDHSVPGTTSASGDAVQITEGSGASVSLDVHYHEFEATSNPGSSLPPFFTVVWIMRIK